MIYIKKASLKMFCFYIRRRELFFLFTPFLYIKYASNPAHFLVQKDGCLSKKLMPNRLFKQP